MKPESATYKKSDILAIAGWWGLFAAFAETVNAVHTHPAIWRDLGTSAMLFNPLLFMLVASPLILFRSRRLERQLLVRVTLGFAFLAFYDASSGLLHPKRVSLLPFFLTLTLTVLAGWLFYRQPERVMWAQKRSLVGMVILAVACLAGFPQLERARERRALAGLPAAPRTARNVIVLVVDTLRADHLSTYGYQRPTSPYLDSLGRQGIVFENAISASSWTLPSHASMLTALYPHDHKAEHDGDNLGSGPKTVSETLMERGYRTAAFSANAGTFGRDRGFGRGFIRFEDDFQSLGSRFGRTFFGGKIESRLVDFHLLQDLLGRPSAADINRRALEWLASDNRPFFLFLNYYDAHDPYIPPEPYLHRYTQAKNPGGRYTQHWEWFEKLTPEQRRAAMDAYDGAINYADDQLKQLIEQLQARGLAENTVLIVTSDHGEGFDEHGLMNHGNSLYRELIHVPLIIWGGREQGRRVADPISLTALPASILELAGQTPDPAFAVPSLRETWALGKSPAPPISELAQLEWFPNFPNYYGSMRSVTTSEWHYIIGGSRGEELFRCCRDGENLAGTAAGKKVCEQFRDDLFTGHSQASDAIAPASPAGKIQSAPPLGPG